MSLTTLRTPAITPHALWIARAMARTDLSPLAPDDLPRLERRCRPRSAAAGELLLAAGRDVDRVLIVRSGEVRLAARVRPAGRHTVALVRAGGVVGDIPLLCGDAMPFDALAARPTEVLELDRDDLLDLLRGSATLSLRWMTSVARRLEHNQRRILAALTTDLTGQVAALLLDERTADPAGPPRVELSHAVLAQLLGASRPAVSRVLRDLRHRGLVTGGYREVELLDLPGLAALAGRDTVAPPCGQGAPPAPAPLP